MIRETVWAKLIPNLPLNNSNCQARWLAETHGYSFLPPPHSLSVSPYSPLPLFWLILASADRWPRLCSFSATLAPSVSLWAVIQEESWDRHQTPALALQCHRAVLGKGHNAQRTHPLAQLHHQPLTYIHRYGHVIQGTKVAQIQGSPKLCASCVCMHACLCTRVCLWNIHISE